ncbi:MAG: hypothetical protein PHX61_10855 [Alphaproteobacteria bacterium]|nr:hypothetical protein [Alphaproteobacteria bacterium]
MSQNVGQIDLDLVLQSKAFKKQLEGTVSSAMKTIDGQVSGLSSMFGQLGKVIGVAFAVKQLARFTSSCLELGSNLSEVQNVVDVTFGSMADHVNEFATSAMEAYGLSETVAKKYTGTFGAMAKSFGFTTEQAVGMSETLTGLAGDVASFYNISTDEAYTKLKSVFTGETESLKELGVVMTQSALDAYALANGYGKTTKSMSEAEKVALRYAFVQSKLNAAAGDFARTSDSWANQTRVLALRFDALKASIGQGLINVLTPVVKFLNIILAKLGAVAKSFASFTGMLMGKKPEASTAAIATDLGSATSAASGLSSGIGGVGSAVDNVGSSAAKAAKKMKSLMNIDEINKLSDNSSDSGGDAGGGAGGGGAGAVEFPSLTPAVETAAEQAGKTFASELAKAFKDGFKISFDTADLAGLKKNIADLKENLKNVFTDPSVVGAAKDFALSVSKAFGQIVGAGASIAVSLGNAIIGGLNHYLEMQGDFIKKTLVNIFNIGSDIESLFGNLSTAIAKIFSAIGTEAGQSMVGGIIGIFGNTFLGYMQTKMQALSAIFTVMIQPIIDNAGKIKDAFVNMFKILSPLFNGIAEGIAAFYSDLNSLYNEVIKPLVDYIASVVSALLGFILDMLNSILGVLGLAAPQINGLGQVIGYVVGAISAALAVMAGWKIAMIVINGLMTAGSAIAGVFGGAIALITSPITLVVVAIGVLVAVGVALVKHWDEVKAFLINIWNAIKDAVTAIFNAIKDVIVAVFNAIKSFIMTIWNAIKAFFTNIWNGIKNIVTTTINAIKSVITTVFNAIKSVITTVLNAIKSVFSAVWNTIKNVVMTIVGTISNIIISAFTTVKNVLTGILNAIKSVFTNVFNALVTIIKAPLNFIIDALNFLIGGLNLISFDIPDWVPFIGGKKFGFNIPKIPRLANGGYVAANTPQLAMIGDNKHEGEIVAPESKIAEAVAAGMQAVIRQLAMLMGGGNAQTQTGDGQAINIYLGDDLLDSIIVSSQNRRNLRSGGRG